MNHTLCAIPRQKREKLISFFYPFLIVGFAIYLLFFAPSALEAVYTGLALCGSKIIPSLFPFMVLGNLFVCSGLAQRFGQRISPVFSRWFHISGNGAAALIIGLFSGFPLGAACAVDLCRRDLLTKKETETLLSFCSNTGPAFLVGSVGVALFGKAQIGWILYVAQAISVLLCGLFAGILQHRKPIDNGGYIELSFDEPERPPLLPVFIEAVTTSVTSILHVCGFVIIFRVFSVMALTVLSLFTNSPCLAAAVSSVLELTTGTEAIADLARQVGMRETLAVGLCGAAVGWSGISVHLQVASLSVTAEAGISLRRYFLGKLWASFACFALSFILAEIFLI